jgi:uncharacterized protein YqgC (DUF456 family)
MSDRNDRSSRAGGSILAIAIVVGAVGGVLAGQPSIGILIGLLLGAAIVGLIWLKDRDR